MIEPDAVDTLPIPEITIEQRAGGARVTVPADVLTGILGPFNGRARQILLGLLQGWSRGMACASAGIDTDTLRAWERREPAFKAATAQAAGLGFAAVYESELYDRALDRGDRGSARLLELVLKARAPEYRDRAQQEITVIHRASQARTEVVGDWQPAAEALPSPEA
jgi:hypothetical protein